ncbi:hypothetical protein PMAYCL1PPCAC_11906, partial [Pristionchus mayeri]
SKYLFQMGPPPLFLLLFFVPLLSSLRFGTFMMKPFTMRKEECLIDDGKEECKLNRPYEGFCVQLMDLLAKEMNVGYIIDTRSGPGNLQPDGNWTGLVDDLISSRVDVAVAPIIITPERSAVLDFSSFFTSGISLMARKPAYRPIRRSLNPYTPVTWMSIVLLQILSIATCITLYSFVNQTDKQKKRHPRFLIWLLSLLIWMISFFLIVGSVLSHSYSAMKDNEKMIDEEGPIRYLNEREMEELGDITEEPREEFVLRSKEGAARFYKSVNEMVEEGEIEYGMQRGGYIHQLFKKANDSLLRKMLETMERNDESSFFSVYPNGIAQVRTSNGTFAFILDDAINLYENTKSPCDTMKIGNNLATYDYGVATTKGTPLSGKVHSAMESMKKKGEIDRIYQHWFIERSQCEVNMRKRKMSTAEMNAVYAIFGMISGIGIPIILSLLITHLERKNDGLLVKNTEEITPMNT